MSATTTIVSMEDLTIQVNNQSLTNPEKVYAMSREITRLVKENHGFSTVMLEGLLIAIAESSGVDFNEVTDLFENMMAEIGARSMNAKKKQKQTEFVFNVKTGQPFQN